MASHAVLTWRAVSSLAFVVASRAVLTWRAGEDDDVLERTNLNRWQGATPSAIGKPKADYLASRLRHMFPEMRVDAVARSVFDPFVLDNLASSDVLDAGVDNDEARYFLNRLSVQYMLPYFDAAVVVTGNGENLDFLARYFLILPGTGACAECTQFTLFDRERTIESFLNEATVQTRRAAGYVLDQPAVVAPSVFTHNQAAVVGRDADRAATFAAKWGDGSTAASTDLAATLARADVLAGYVCTPHPQHAIAARAALEAGKPVLCEKPLTPSAATTRPLVALARQRNVFLMEGVWTRFPPIYETVRGWISQGRIGAVRAMQSSFLIERPPREPVATDRRYAAALGGGTLLDIGIYNLTVSRMALPGVPVRALDVQGLKNDEAG